MVKGIKILIFLISIFSLSLLIVPHVNADSSKYIYASASVISVNSIDSNQNDVKVTIDSGSAKGSVVDINDSGQNNVYYYKPGDHILVTYTTDSTGKLTAYIIDFDRRAPLIILISIFLILMLLICMKQGLFSLLSLGISIVIVISVLISPAQKGQDPFILAIFSSLLILPITYFIAHGISRKTFVSIISSFITLIVTVILAYIFMTLAKLSAITPTDEINYLKQSHSLLYLRDLYLAGIVIGTVAVLNDITISQASTVRSLFEANSKLSKVDLFKHAMGVGRDHIASLVNTLVLVYIGSSLPLFLTMYDPSQPLSFSFNTQIIALEIIRTFSASIGIVLAVPITTYLAVLAYTRKNLK